MLPLQQHGTMWLSACLSREHHCEEGSCATDREQLRVRIMSTAANTEKLMQTTKLNISTNQNSIWLQFWELNVKEVFQEIEQKRME